VTAIAHLHEELDDAKAKAPTDGNANRRSLPMSQSAAWSPKRVTTRYWAFGALAVAGIAAEPMTATLLTLGL
jgi:hypothetical protein